MFQSGLKHWVALAAQLEQERREGKTWQKRVRELLDKTGKSVGQEAFEQLDKAREELQAFTFQHYYTGYTRTTNIAGNVWGGVPH